MEIAPVPENEPGRLRALNEYYITDTLPETDFDDIIRMAADICHAPISSLGIIDDHREWFKSSHGLDMPEIAREHSLGAYAINTPGQLFIVSDLSKDSRFSDNPLVTSTPHAVFYAAVPLVTPEGYAIGTLSVWDYKPRTLDASQVSALHSLARQLATLLELRKITKQLNQNRTELKRAYADLEKFSTIASHDLKSPLNNIISITHLLKDDYGSKLDADGNEYVTYLNDAAYQLADLVNGILSYSVAAQLSVEQKEQVNVAALIDTIKYTLVVPANCSVSYESVNRGVYTSPAALKQILKNLLQYAIKRNDKPQIIIEITLQENKSAYTFEVKDNGPCIPEKDSEKIFDLFETMDNYKRFGPGNNLAVVKRLVEKSGGEIKLNSDIPEGTTFTFSIPK